MSHASAASTGPSERAETFAPHAPHTAPTYEEVTLVPRSYRGWLAALALSLLLLAVLIVSIIYLVVAGVGIWGVNVPVGWGVDISNFIWWFGIGHGATLLAALLFLVRNELRRSIGRLAETVALCALACAGLFPILHLGRPYFAYWIFPYPNTYGVWPQFRSALVWDAFAINVYLVVAVSLWYVGLLPDLAYLRDQARNRWIGRILAFFALGWHGEAEQWHLHHVASRLIAGAAVGLIAFHSIGALDFAISVLPFWNTAVLPPFFVVGALLAAIATILLVGLPLRGAYGWDDFLAPRHLDALGQLLLAMSLLVGYGHAVELFGAWYGTRNDEAFQALLRLQQPFAGYYGSILVLNVLAPQVLWLRAARRAAPVLWSLGLLLLVGMWLERFLLIVASQQRDFLPSSWGAYSMTVWDTALFVGTFGLFFTLLLPLLRLVPIASWFEVWPPRLHRGGPAPVAAEDEGEGDGAAIYGLLAEWETADELTGAAERLHSEGYRQLLACTPAPVAALRGVLGRGGSWLPWLAVSGAITSGIAGYAMQVYFNVWDYPLNVGGRPLHSWPAFLVIAVLFAVLGASLAALLGMLALGRMPSLYHPLFNVPAFARASHDRCFLCVRASDERFEVQQTRRLLDELNPIRIWEVPS